MFVRQTFHKWALQSLKKCGWVKERYKVQLDHGSRTLRFVPSHLSGSGFRSGVGLTIPITTPICISRGARAADLAQPNSKFTGRPVDLFRSYPRLGIDNTTQMSNDTAC